ncbi:MAG: glyoxylate/hydroxypyruvate reductase A [Bacteroidota bacterium]
MAIVIIAPTRDTSIWAQGLLDLDPTLEIYEHPQVPADAHDRITCAITWLHPEGSLASFPNLNLICSMGAGVDHMLADSLMPEGIPITRIVDPALAWSMSNFVITAMLNYHRNWEHFRDQQKVKRWAQADTCERPLRIGVLGLGVLGQDLASKTASLGFYTAGFSQSPKEVANVESFVGEAQLDAFLQAVNVLVCLLPLTSSTENFLNRELFSRCQPGTFLINVARGKHLVEEDLIPALESGQLSGAVLDVFRQEPLPEEHAFWSHPQIVVTPHHASLTNPAAAIPQLYENYQRAQNGEPLLNQVDRKKGY